MASHFLELVLVAVVAAVVVRAGKLRARNPATKLEGTPPLSKQDKIMFFVGCALIAAVALIGLLKG